MKPLLLFLALGITCNAQQVIYKSTGHQIIYGNGRITRVTALGFLVLDPNTFKGTGIGAFTLNGQKLYTVVPMAKYRADFVTGTNGAVYTVLSKAESPGTQFAGILMEAAYFRGRNTFFQTGPLSSAFLPKTFSTYSRAIAHNDQNNVTTSGEASGSSLVDLRATFQSNQNGETFDHAVQRYADYFAARGYTFYSAPPAK